MTGNKKTEDKDDKKRKKGNVVSSKEIDPEAALEYWTKDKQEKAKPIPMPKPDPDEEK